MLRPFRLPAAALPLALGLGVPAVLCVAFVIALPGRIPSGRELAPGVPVEGELRSGETVSLVFDLNAGEYLHLAVEQRGVDLVASLSDPPGREILRADSPTGAQGEEQVHAVAREAGRHRLELRSLTDQGSGRYRVVLDVPRPATVTDRVRAASAQAFARGEQWRSRGDAAGLRRALGAYEEALRGWRSTGDLPEQLLALRRMGQISERLGEARMALDRFRPALDLARALADRKSEARLLNESGAACRALGAHAAAEEAFERALRIARDLGDRREEAVAWNNLGVLHGSLAQSRRALAAYEEALALWRLLGDRWREAATLHNLGMQYGQLGRLPEARDLLTRALELRRAAADHRGEAASLTALGWIEELAGHLARAVALQEQALRLRRASGDLRGVANTLGRIGTLLARSGRPREALAAYVRALEIVRRLGDRGSEAYLLTAVGWLDNAQGRPGPALRRLEPALRLFGRLGDRPGEANALLEIARAERRRGALRTAVSRCEEALAIVDVLRDEAWSEPLRVAYLASRYEHYELCIDLLMALDGREPERGFAERAFDVGERARARALLDGVSPGEGPAAVPGPPDRAAAVDARIRAVERRRMELAGDHPAAGERRAELERDLRRLLVERDLIAAQAGSGDGRLDLAPLGLPQIQRQLLEPDTVLLQYVLGSERSYLWLVTPEAVVSRVLPGRDVIEARARRVHELLAKSRRFSLRRQAALESAALSELVLGPVAELLGAKRLLIVADGALQAIPFAALSVPRTDPDARGEPLLARHEIVHLPSASVMVRLRQRLARRSPAPHRLAVVADPVFQSGDARFPRLPFSRREAAAILRLVPPRESFQALGFAASRETVLSGRLGLYRIVHFATHGVLHPEHSDLSGVALTMVDQQGRPRDGFLRAQEIRALDLPADLVVLSACRTAIGQEVRGEGLMGLPRSFFHAGAGRVLVSLWGVDDEAAAVLMDRFYRRLLRDGLPPGRALREAQLSLQREPRWRAPYYWSGFMLQGEWR